MFPGLSCREPQTGYLETLEPCLSAWLVLLQEGGLTESQCSLALGVGSSSSQVVLLPEGALLFSPFCI